MSNPALLGSITYEAESSWGENVTTFATHRLPILTAPDVSGLVHNKSTAEFTEQYRGAGHPPVLMTMGGSFTVELYLAGHGSTTSGSPSLDEVENFLGWVFGNVALSAASSTTVSSGTATSLTTAASGTFSAGGLCRVGSLGDGDGDGQFYGISTHSTITLSLLNGLRGTPANGAVVYPVAMLYESSAPTATSVTGRRFQILTANMQYNCHGCFPQAVAISNTGPGGAPRIAVTVGVSWWTDTANVTFPSAVTSNRYVPAPVAAGSLHVNTVGTATRNELVCRNFEITWDPGVVPLTGSGGVNRYQDIVGAVRTPGSVGISFVVDSHAAGTTTIPGWGRGTDCFTVVYTASATAGSALGFKFPKVYSNTVPVQINDNGINRLRFEGTAVCSDTLTSELTRARMVMGLA